MTTCAGLRGAIQERLDGPIDPALERELAMHLAACAECREYHDGLVALRARLRALAMPPLPDDALESVWARTLRAARPPRRRAAAWWLDWRYAAAVAALLLLVIVPVLLRRPSAPAAPPEVTSAEVARAARDLGRVLALTEDAFRRTESVARDRVLAGEVSPAIRRIPVIGTEPRSSRRTRT